MLFYQKVSPYLIKKGFTINPYDPCAENKILNGKYMMVTWHVSDLKTPHVESIEMTRMIKWL